MKTTWKPPFPWFGGKSRIAHEVWARLGDCRNYVEPFFGSGAVLFLRPAEHERHTETVNDKDGLLANFWRALQADPEAVAHHADWPVNENDLTARHTWLVERKDSLQDRLEGDPDFFDAQVAGWWCWGLCCWIGSGWCSGQGPWHVREVDGARQLVHLGNAGQGVNRQRVELVAYLRGLADRLRGVRVCCGDWKRVTGRCVTYKHGLTGVFLDPPYAGTTARCSDLYRQEDLSVSHAVREWALANGSDPRMRIALCGYEGEHAMPNGWECLAWKTAGGYSSRGSRGDVNRHRERIWFSPHCLTESRAALASESCAVA